CIDNRCLWRSEAVLAHLIVCCRVHRNECRVWRSGVILPTQNSGHKANQYRCTGKDHNKQDDGEKHEWAWTTISAGFQLKRIDRYSFFRSLWLLGAGFAARLGRFSSFGGSSLGFHRSKVVLHKLWLCVSEQIIAGK